jgi:hypothetical protein
VSPVPSVGRDVHYVSYGTPGGEYSSVCRAAKITEVHEPSELTDNRVGLCVFNPTGLFFNTAVQDEHDHAGGTWHWPERVGD